MKKLYKPLYVLTLLFIYFPILTYSSTADYSLTVNKECGWNIISQYNTSDYSLSIKAKAADIISYLLDDGEYISDAKLDTYYSLNVESKEKISEIKDKILTDFIQVIGYKLAYQAVQIDVLELSWLEGVDECDAIGKANNPTANIFIKSDKRSYLVGQQLNDFCEKLNSIVEEELFVAGNMDVNNLPSFWILKRKLESNPTTYLEKKGFKVMESEKIIRIPKIINS